MRDFEVRGSTLREMMLWDEEWKVTVMATTKDNIQLAPAVEWIFCPDVIELFCHRMS
jgi:hypothetical protein